MSNKSPTKQQVQRARINAKMTGLQASEVVGVSDRQWRKYEAGTASMSYGLWLLFCIRTGQVKPTV